MVACVALSRPLQQLRVRKGEKQQRATPAVVKAAEVVAAVATSVAQLSPALSPGQLSGAGAVANGAIFAPCTKTTGQTAMSSSCSSSTVENPPLLAQQQQNVEHLKHQLLQAVDNGEMANAIETIVALEAIVVTKEILQVTRIGALVNDLRKRVLETSPELSRRCRTLIKCWQRVAEPGRPLSSGSSSTNGTPNLSSPAGRLGLTPCTPIAVTFTTTSRITPTGSRDTQSCATPTTVTSNGHTATPRVVASSAATGGNVKTKLSLHRSNTIDADLARKAVEDSLAIIGATTPITRNGKRKAAVAAIDQSITGIINGCSSSPSVEQPLTKKARRTSAVASPVNAHNSVLAARRANVKPTSELVAQLTENLPNYISIDLSKNVEAVDVKKAEQSAKAAKPNQRQLKSSRGSVSAVELSALADEATKKEKRGKKKEKNNVDVKVEHLVKNQQLTTVVVKLTKSELDEVEPANSVPTSVAEVAYDETSSTSESKYPFRNGKYDWNAILPSLETLRNREHFRAKPHRDSQKPYLMDVGGRKIIALPYIDIGLPDFLEYEYPNSKIFYAEESFMYGAPRPK